MDGLVKVGRNLRYHYYSMFCDLLFFVSKIVFLMSDVMVPPEQPGEKEDL